MDGPRPATEEERLAALEAYAVMDSDPEPAFDELVDLASRICRTPIALITLLDETRQWFKAKRGLDRSETPREQAFCAHTIQQDGTFVVPDAATDVRFRENPLVLGDPGIRFYAGAPIRTPEGHRLGSLCVIDRSPRATLTPDQHKALEVLSSQASRLLEHRRVAARLADALERVRLLAPLVPICAWCKRIRDDRSYWSAIGEYLEAHAGIKATHGICPSCVHDLQAETGPS